MESGPVFDLNAPIVTPGWFNTLDNSEPESHVLPLAATPTSASFPVHWTGTDEGAGIGDFTVYVSEDGGPFEVWLPNTTFLSDMFSDEEGRTYAFYSVARDLTGNVEDKAATSEAVTRVAVVGPDGDLDGDGDVSTGTTSTSSSRRATRRRTGPTTRATATARSPGSTPASPRRPIAR